MSLLTKFTLLTKSFNEYFNTQSEVWEDYTKQTLNIRIFDVTGEKEYCHQYSFSRLEAERERDDGYMHSVFDKLGDLVKRRRLIEARDAVTGAVLKPTYISTDDGTYKEDFEASYRSGGYERKFPPPKFDFKPILEQVVKPTIHVTTPTDVTLRKQIVSYGKY